MAAFRFSSVFKSNIAAKNCGTNLTKELFRRFSHKLNQMEINEM